MGELSFISVRLLGVPGAQPGLGVPFDKSPKGLLCHFPHGDGGLAPVVNGKNPKTHLEYGWTTDHMDLKIVQFVGWTEFEHLIQIDKPPQHTLLWIQLKIPTNNQCVNIIMSPFNPAAGLMTSVLPFWFMGSNWRLVEKATKGLKSENERKRKSPVSEGISFKGTGRATLPLDAQKKEVEGPFKGILHLSLPDPTWRSCCISRSPMA